MVDRILLKDFRNYKELDLSFSDGLNILQGKNAQGKTNVLEAIYLCALGKSHRIANDADMIRQGRPFAQTTIYTKDHNKNGSIKMQLTRGGVKKVLVDQVPIKKMVELMGKLMVVMFSPEDLQLIKEGPVFRRKYIDTFLCQIKPSYFYNLQNYNRSLKHRNKLIIKKDNAMLDVFDQQIASYGTKIVNERKKFIDILKPICIDQHDLLTNGENIDINYVCSISKNNVDEEEYLRQLYNARSLDFLRGYTTKGVHRDDLSIYVYKKDARKFASQGQQRSLALSLRLSQAIAMEKYTDIRPVLLLDDVLSELDNDRITYLLSILEENQTILTSAMKVTTDSSNLSTVTFLVESGRIQRV